MQQNIPPINIDLSLSAIFMNDRPLFSRLRFAFHFLSSKFPLYTSSFAILSYIRHPPQLFEHTQHNTKKTE